MTDLCASNGLVTEFVDDILLSDFSPEAVEVARWDIENKPLFVRPTTRLTTETIKARFVAVIDMFAENGFFDEGADPGRDLDSPILKKYIASAHRILKTKVDQATHLDLQKIFRGRTSKTNSTPDVRVSMSVIWIPLNLMRL